MQNNYHQDIPPWNTLASWTEANRSLCFFIQRNQADLEGAIVLAQKIHTHLGSIFSILDDLCNSTCPWCPDPCCLTARVWIDFKDLLLIHLSGHQNPPKQLLPNLKTSCRYWSYKGCVLPRMTRPWICTWYLCPTQKANLCRETRYTQDEFSRLIQAVKVCRREMEDEFVRIVCSG
jgi:hypothetical protein